MAGESIPISSRKSIPAMCELEEPRLGLPRIGEGAALVAEGSASSRVFGNRRTVDVDERRAGAGTARCMVRATRPLPVPVSPRRRIGGGRGAVAARFKMCSSCSRNRRMPVLAPMISARSFTGRIIPLSAYREPCCSVCLFRN